MDVICEIPILIKPIVRASRVALPQPLILPQADSGSAAGPLYRSRMALLLTALESGRVRRSSTTGWPALRALPAGTKCFHVNALNATSIFLNTF
jgi:hypothetical protein